jgi:hypothetical protein
MTVTDRGFVVFGDVVRSRDEPAGSTDWLRTLSAELDRRIPAAERLARFGFTQGDELQGLLRPSGDPLAVFLLATLHPEARPMRWVVVAGSVEPGRGPATQRTGPAFLAARELLEADGVRRDLLRVQVGSEPADSLLAELAPLLGDLVSELTTRQRAMARLMILDGRRQTDVAERLRVSRATISVMAERARIRRINGLIAALRRIISEGVAGGTG